MGGKVVSGEVIEWDTVVASLRAMTKSHLVRGLPTSPEVIRLAVILYVRFPLSLQNVEDLPQGACFFTVLRQSMAIDSEAGMQFGTDTGSVFSNFDEAESWSEIVRHRPTILSVETVGLNTLCVLSLL